MLKNKLRAARRNTMQKGDTLIEVLFAVTVFSLVVVLSLSIMNQGTSASIRALQITLVRQEIDSQAEALRFMSTSYIAAYHPAYAPANNVRTPAAEFHRIITSPAVVTGSVTPFGQTDGPNCSPAPTNSFILDTRSVRYVAGSPTVMQPAQGFAQVTYNGNTIAQSQGVWIEAVRSPRSSDAAQANARYTDFHIRACWDAPGVGQPINLGTIVRLYEPAS